MEIVQRYCHANVALLFKNYSSHSMTLIERANALYNIIYAYNEHSKRF
jgi:hypothetical protein